MSFSYPVYGFLVVPENGVFPPVELGYLAGDGEALGRTAPAVENNNPETVQS